jgi:predicted amidohydrolase
LIRQAHRAGARLVVTPEMTSLMDRRPGALAQKAKTETDDGALLAFRKLAAEIGCALILGSLPIRLTATLCANRSFVISPGGDIIACYDKIHMFDVKLSEEESYSESQSYQPGNEAVMCRIGPARIGLTICYDVRFPCLYRALAKAGADLITVPAAFTHLTGSAHWHVLLRARAIETGSFVLAPAQSGVHADGRRTFGHSLIVNPWGEIIAEAGEQTGVIHAELDLDEVPRARARMPSLRHERPFISPLSQKMD